MPAGRRPAGREATRARVRATATVDRRDRSGPSSCQAVGEPSARPSACRECCVPRVADRAPSAVASGLQGPPAKLPSSLARWGRRAPSFRSGSARHRRRRRRTLDARPASRLARPRNQSSLPAATSRVEPCRSMRLGGRRPSRAGRAHDVSRDRCAATITEHLGDAADERSRHAPDRRRDGVDGRSPDGARPDGPPETPAESAFVHAARIARRRSACATTRPPGSDLGTTGLPSICAARAAAARASRP
jgi:hypothetical protein